MSASAAPDGELPNLGLLIKLLKMTTSSNDGEALIAMRKANEQLIKFGGDWEALLSGKVTVIGDPFVKMDAPRDSDIRRSQHAKPPPPHSAPRPQPQPKPQPQAAPQRPTASARPRPQARPQPAPQPTPQPTPTTKKPSWSNVDRVKLDDIV